MSLDQPNLIAVQKVLRDHPDLISKDELKEFKKLQAEANQLFEWADGILIESMQKGGLLLIDEISLANDSVLERLNSVFETERTLVLSEKSSLDDIKIKAQDKFNVVATMNPGGDYGKKELSPAMRNRMTEIWVQSYFEQDNLKELCIQRLNSQIFDSVQILDKVDIFTVIKEKVADEKLSLIILNLVLQINFFLPFEFFSLQRKGISLRDVFNLISFIQTVTKDKNMKLAEAVFEGT